MFFGTFFWHRKWGWACVYPIANGGTYCIETSLVNTTEARPIRSVAGAVCLPLQAPFSLRSRATAHVGNHETRPGAGASGVDHRHFLFALGTLTRGRVHAEYATRRLPGQVSKALKKEQNLNKSSSKGDHAVCDGIFF